MKNPLKIFFSIVFIISLIGSCKKESVLLSVKDQVVDKWWEAEDSNYYMLLFRSNGIYNSSFKYGGNYINNYGIWEWLENASNTMMVYINSESWTQTINNYDGNCFDLVVSDSNSSVIVKYILSNKIVVNYSDRQICTGVSIESFLPLKKGNTWSYPGAWDLKVSVGDSIHNNNKVYYTIINSEVNNIDWEDVYSIDALGNIYTTIENEEYLLIPESPILYNEWEYPVCCAYSNSNIGTRQVSSINETITTDYCVYTNCLEITEYNGDGEKKTIFYYKKGLGLVRKDGLSLGVSDLLSVNLN